MRSRLLRSFIFIMSLFAVAFIMTSCNNDNNANTSIENNSTSLPETNTNIGNNSTSLTETNTNTTIDVLNTYTITWKNYDGEVLELDTNVKEGVKPEYNGETPKRLEDNQYKYTFNGWDSDVVECNGDKTYTATYTSNIKQYNVKFVDYDGTTIIKNPVLYDYGTKPENIAKPDKPTRDADETYTYEFECWTPEIGDVTGDAIYKAKYKASYIDYSVSLTSNTDWAGELEGAGSYHYNDTVTITAKPNQDHVFEGWFIGEKLYEDDSSFEYTVTSSLSIEARFKRIFKIYIEDFTDAGVVGITSGEKYELDSEITLTATKHYEGYVFKWKMDTDDEVIDYGKTFTFKVPNQHTTIQVDKIQVFTREYKKIVLGRYPQSNVKATKSNGLLDITFDESTWTSYKYYVDSTQTDYMYYKDFDMDDDGIFDYRAVYYSQYRPYYYTQSSSNGTTRQDENGYATNTVHWFKYEPVEWKIIGETDGKALIIANLILDSQDWYPNDTTDSFTHNDGEGYVNNYELSNIKKWLNDDFYNTAFNDLEKIVIEKTTVDNSADSVYYGYNNYLCNNTDDKIFLLSSKEAYYSDELVKQAKGTDYAKCQGLEVSKTSGYQGNSSWWLRSPDFSDALNASCISIDGGLYASRAMLTYYGIRPACWIDL